ncbi:protein-disulfide reductase DsbD domain-containing protein, partial [Symmachiella dynata]|uniref:protein-disulfide reductase DsbD domain-containing protein n=1 Tax=Symmachiella dynata TaxID=2527995 RepID=UPI0030ECA1AD
GHRRTADDSTGFGTATKKKEPEIVTGKAYLSVDKLPPGKTCEVIVVLQIDGNWHINANPAGDEFALATEFTMKSKLKTKLGKVQYPKGKKMAVAGFDKPLSVYSKFAALRATLEVPAAAAGQKEELLLSVHYQACDDKRCLRPTKLELKVPIAVAREGEPVKKINQKLFAKKRKSKKRDDN